MSYLNKIPQSTSANQDLFIDLNDKDAETMSGGRCEVFKVQNQTRFRIPYRVDGVRTKFPNAGQSSIWTTTKGGKIVFDKDYRTGIIKTKTYNLSNLGKYAFRINKGTADPYDIELYRVGRLS